MQQKVFKTTYQIICIELLLQNAENESWKFKIMEKIILDNGMTLLLEEDHTAPAAALQIGYKVGSRNEELGKTGLSHLTEHLMFRGTHKYPGDALNNLLYDMGAEFNAHTDYDSTIYYEIIPDNFIENAISLEADRMAYCNMTCEDFEKERSIVISELQMYEGEPEEVLANEVCNAHFKNHPYRWPVIGYIEDLQRMEHADLLEHYHRYYIPNNAVAVLLGNFQKADALKLFQNYFGKIPAGKTPPQLLAREPIHIAKKRVTIKRNCNGSFLSVVFTSPPRSEDDRIALLMAKAALANGKSSRLYKKIMESGMASGFYGTVWDSIDQGLFELNVQLQDRARAAECEEAIFEALEDLKQNPPEGEELEKIRTLFKAGIIYSAEDIEGRSSLVTNNWTLGDENYTDRLFEVTSKLTPDEIAAAAKKYLTENQCTVGELLSDGSAAPSEPSDSKKKMYKKQFTLGTISGVTPKYSSYQLQNGIKVLIRELNDCELFRFGGYITGAGSASDEKEGTAYLTAAMLKEGTKNRSWEAISEFEDSNAFEFGLIINKDRLDLSGRALSEKLEPWLENMIDILTSPKFGEEEFKKLKSRRISRVKSLEDDTQYMADLEFNRLFYGRENRMGRSYTGTAETLATIEREDLEQFYHNYFHPKNITMIFAGNLKKEALIEQLEQRLGSWRKNEVAAKIPEYTPEPENQNLSIITIPDKPQNFIFMGHEGVEKNSEDFIPFTIINSHIGGSALTSKLGVEIRINRGMVYFIGSSAIPYKNGSQWLVWFGTSPENSESAISHIKNLLTEIRENGITQQELNKVTNNLKNSFKVELIGIPEQISMIKQIEYYGLDKNYADKILERYETVTTDEINALMKKTLHPEKMLTVIAGGGFK